MFGEPLHLIALKLVFWACVALADGISIVAIMEKEASNSAINMASQKAPLCSPLSCLLWLAFGN